MNTFPPCVKFLKIDLSNDSMVEPMGEREGSRGRGGGGGIARLGRTDCCVRGVAKEVVNPSFGS